MAMIDETGKTYGFLKVIQKAPLPGRKKQGWLCECSLCGGTKVISGSDLRAHKYTSCGCKKQTVKQEMPGAVYGNLMVKCQDPAPANTFADKSIHWICLCQTCGREVSVSGRNLRNGQTTSCGCNKSYGEMVIASYLDQHSIFYKREFTFADLKDKQKLRFDFAIFTDKNATTPILLLEFNGIQHYQKNNGFFTQNPQKFNILQSHDEQKREYCLCDCNIPLVIISNETGIVNRTQLKENIFFLLNYIFINLKEKQLNGKILTIDCGDVAN